MQDETQDPVPQPKPPRILFSARTGGFYLEGISSAVPEDATPISAARHAELLAHGGAHIAACPKTGKPISTAPKPGSAQHRADLTNSVRSEAARRIRAVSPIWRQINDTRESTPEGEARFSRIDAIRDASNLIENQLSDAAAKALADFPIATHPLWPEL